MGVARGGVKESKTVSFREREREDRQRTRASVTERKSTNTQQDNRRYTWEQQPTGRAEIEIEQGIAKRTCQSLWVCLCVCVWGGEEKTVWFS